LKAAIVIGASSGIGRALAVGLSADGYRVGLVARRTELLAQVASELPGPSVIKTVDVSEPELAMPLVRELIEELGDVELFIVNAGVGFENRTFEWAAERDTIGVNVVGLRRWSTSPSPTWKRAAPDISSASPRSRR
jgi:short-subunit dehydrogenase